MDSRSPGGDRGLLARSKHGLWRRAAFWLAIVVVLGAAFGLWVGEVYLQAWLIERILR